MRLQLLVLVTAVLAAGGCATNKMPSAGKNSSGDQGVGGSTGTSSGSSGTHTASTGASAGTAGGAAAPSAGTDASTKSAEQGSGGSAYGGPAQTPEERRAAVDKRLDESLGNFDSELRKEQDAVAKERDARQAANAGSTTTDENGENGDDADAEAGTAVTEGPPTGNDGKSTDAKNDSSSKPGRPGDLKSEKQRGGNTTGGSTEGSGTAARKIPDGSDDDIVARRLRKAAEQETDPELKDKLWKEYIEYKKNNA